MESQYLSSVEPPVSILALKLIYQLNDKWQCSVTFCPLFKSCCVAPPVLELALATEEVSPSPLDSASSGSSLLSSFCFFFISLHTDACHSALTQKGQNEIRFF